MVTRRQGFRVQQGWGSEQEGGTKCEAGQDASEMAGVLGVGPRVAWPEVSGGDRSLMEAGQLAGGRGRPPLKVR